MERDKTLVRIRTDAGTLSGKPTVRDTRVAVEHVLGMMADGATADEILRNYPFIEPEDVQACVAYAWKLVAQEEIEPLHTSTAGTERLRVRRRAADSES